MPGIFPSSASLRSMIRLIRNFRYTPRARPVSSQRRTRRLEYFGVLLLLATCAFVAIGQSLFQLRASSGLRKGMPSSASTNRLNTGFEFEKQQLMFIPCVNWTSAMLISGNTPCSVRPNE